MRALDSSEVVVHGLDSGAGAGRARCRPAACRAAAPLALIAALGASACGQGEGTVIFNLAAGGVPTAGIPAATGEDDEAAGAVMADGWSIAFERFVVGVAGPSIGADGVVHAASEDDYVVDLAAGDPSELVRLGAQDGRWDELAWGVLPPGDATVNVNASDVAVEAMHAAGSSLSIVGRGNRGTRLIRFDLEVPAATALTHCENGLDGGDGVTVRSGALTKAELSVRAAAVFATVLGDDDAALRFEAIAAVAGADGIVTWDELSMQPLDAPVDADGTPILDESGDPVVYDAAGSGATTLQDFVLASLVAGLRLNGTGACEAEPWD